jgi:hypothetical protein
MPVILGRMRRVDDEKALRRCQTNLGIEGLMTSSGAYPRLNYAEEGEPPVKLPEKSDKLKAKIGMRKFRARSEAYPKLRLRG